jgi:hypothetical protein
MENCLYFKMKMFINLTRKNNVKIGKKSYIYYFIHTENAKVSITIVA